MLSLTAWPLPESAKKVYFCLGLDQQKKSESESFLIGREGFKDIYRNILKNPLDIYLSVTPGLLNFLKKVF